MLQVIGHYLHRSISIHRYAHNYINMCMHKVHVYQSIDNETTRLGSLIIFHFINSELALASWYNIRTFLLIQSST